MMLCKVTFRTNASAFFPEEQKDITSLQNVWCVVVWDAGAYVWLYVWVINSTNLH